MSEKNWSLFSALISAVLILILVQLWAKMNVYTTEPTQLVNAKAVDPYLEAWENVRPATTAEDSQTITIKTGIFIQSLKFHNSSEVNLTGYLWQYYEKDIPDEIKLKPGEVGFIFPEQVDSSFKPQEVYRYKGDNGEVIGWYFESTLRQPFEYDDYPFDHKTVWVRMWSKHFEKNVVLVPDFEAYTKGTGLDDIFGIEQEIVLGTWERANTFFNYKLSDYGTNFGIQDYVGRKGFPELHYNFVIKRKFENAFIVHLLPLFLVSALLFAALLTVSGNRDLATRHGFSTSGVIGTSSALFFVVLLAHIQLREQFAGTSVVYMEYFYFLMYGMLLLLAVNTFLFSIRAAPWLNIVHYRDNLIPKVLFWPVLLACMVLITLFSL